jgi:MYXO-CTERM domain-containing protein
LNVTLSGAATLDQTVTTSETDDVGYTLFSFDFVSTGGNATLTFTPDDFSPEPNFMLDNVSVTSPSADTPEPGFLPVLGLLGLALLRKAGVVSRT